MSSTQQILQEAQKALKQKAYGDAEDKAYLVIKTEPTNSAAWHLLGLVYLEKKNYQEALGYFQKAVQGTPKAIYYFNMAIACKRLGLENEVIDAYEKCVKLDPRLNKAWLNLGNAYRAKNLYSKALTCYTKSLTLEPESSITHYNMGVLFHLEEKLDDAIKAYRRTIKYDPENAKAYSNLGTIYSKLRRYKKSIMYYEKALLLDPYLFDAYNNYGGTLVEMQQFDSAEKKLRKALKLKPDSATTLRNITLCKSYENPDDKDAQYITTLLENPQLTEEDRIQLYFALGKIHHDCHNYEKAFNYFKQGNELNYKLHPFNIYSIQDYVRSIITTFDDTFIMTHKNMARTKLQPLLIIGQPRSGKSILESLLVNHPEINGAGEVGLAEFCSRRETQHGMQNFPLWVPSMREDDAQNIVNAYENRMLRDTHERRYLIDTMPGNAFYLGLFAVLYPEVKVIWIDRDPLDLNLMMYFKYFVNKHYYAYNLKVLGQYHRIFQRLMDHFNDLLPNQIHHITYESLVQKPNQTIEGILEFLDLKPMKLESTTLNTAEIGQHQHYAAQLEPLKQGLMFDPKSDAIRVKQILKEGTQKHKEQQYEEAAKLYRYALQYEPNNPVPIHLLGVIAFETNRYDKAVELIEQALEINPNYAQAHNNLGVVYQALNQHTKAESHFKIAQAILEATQSDKAARLTQAQRDALQGVLSKPLKVMAEYERKILYRGQLTEDGSTASYMAKSWDWYFKDLSYGSYRNGGTKENPVWRMRAWHFLLKNISVIQQIFNHEKQTLKILDVGCSSGFFRRFLEGNITPDESKRIYYWGLDVRQNMLEKALKETMNIESGAAGNYCPTAYVLHDVVHGLPFEDNSFDMIVNFEMIKYLPHSVGIQLIYEMYRVLDTQGYLFMSTSYDAKMKEFMQSMPYEELKNIFGQKGLELLGEYGGQTPTKILLDGLTPADRQIASKLMKYHCPDMVASWFAPFYPQLASQRVFHLKKNSG